MEINAYFSSPIACFHNENFDLMDYCLEIKEKYPIVQKKGWIHTPYNTFWSPKSKYDTLKDPYFFELTKWVQECVNEVNEECGYKDMFPNDMWFNVYKRGDSQEFHKHELSHLSCIYIAEGQEDDSKIYFIPPNPPMFPIPVKIPHEWNYERVCYPSNRGRLIVFKSDILHMVERKVTDTPRITFSWNFVCKQTIETQRYLDKIL